MEKLFTFLVTHWALTGLWVVLLLLLMRDSSNKSGQKVSTSEATALYNNEDAILLDIRDHGEFSKGHVANSVNIPNSALKSRLAELNSHKDAPIVIICKTGQTASIAGKTLMENEFSRVYRMNGGIMEWTNNNLPLVAK